MESPAMWTFLIGFFATGGESHPALAAENQQSIAEFLEAIIPLWKHIMGISLVLLSVLWGIVILLRYTRRRP